MRACKKQGIQIDKQIDRWWELTRKICNPQTRWLGSFVTMVQAEIFIHEKKIASRVELHGKRSKLLPTRISSVCLGEISAIFSQVLQLIDSAPFRLSRIILFTYRHFIRSFNYMVKLSSLQYLDSCLMEKLGTGAQLEVDSSQKPSQHQFFLCKLLVLTLPTWAVSKRQ